LLNLLAEYDELLLTGFVIIRMCHDGFFSPETNWVRRAREAGVFKRMVIILSMACLVTGIAQATENPFIGEWKLDPAKSRMPDEMKVDGQGAKYAFDFGGGVEAIAVDGTFQQGYGKTLLSVKAEAPDTWIVERKQDDRLMLKATWKLAKDGKTLTDYFREFDADGSILSMDYIYQRMGGGSGFAGDWQSIKETMNLPFSMQVKAFEGDGLSFIIPSQHSTRNVKLDGKEYPKQGPSAAPGASSSTRRMDERNLVITDKAGANVSVIEEIGLSADLKTLTVTVHIPGHDKPTVMIFNRQ
jgi:hypothetical protein